MVYAVGMVSVVEDDDEGKCDEEQQRQRAFPGRKHDGT